MRRPSTPLAAEGEDLVLLTPKVYVPPGPGQAGLMVVQADGKLRWFLPTDKPPFDLQYQQLNGKPVLTWWEGTVTTGTGAGEAVIADLSFNELARIGEVDGLWPDLHELVLTDQGTALMTAYHPVAADLSSVGGPKKGFLLGAVAMEVDVATKKLLHRWDSVDHVPVEESYQELPKGQGTEKTPFDYFHINSITLSPDGELLISGRNTWALYKVGRASGDVIWRLNGKKSDFDMGAGSHFYWQHMARYDGASRITPFRRWRLARRRTSVAGHNPVRRRGHEEGSPWRRRSCTRPACWPRTRGSVQVLEDGGVLVGWGAQPYFSRFSARRRPGARRPVPDERRVVPCLYRQVRRPTHGAAGRRGRGRPGRRQDRVCQLERVHRSGRVGGAGRPRRPTDPVGPGRLGRLRDCHIGQQHRAPFPGGGARRRR